MRDYPIGVVTFKNSWFPSNRDFRRQPHSFLSYPPCEVSIPVLILSTEIIDVPSKLDHRFHNSSLQSPASSLRPYTRAPLTLPPREITIDKYSIVWRTRLGLEQCPRRHAKT
jgi:hypothetical protein